MKRALKLAEQGAGFVNPNPLAGAVIVKGARVIGEGYHAFFGGAHAEISALRACRESPKGSTVYVNLEPCSHHGKTPPCCEALIAAGVSRVVSAMEDPNPAVSGEGHRRLRAAGIEVAVGILESEARRANEVFIKFITTGRPFVLLKSAATLDGKTASVTGSSKWISSDASRRYAHRLRQRFSAVMVGIGTVLADDPLLTARANSKERCANQGDACHGDAAHLKPLEPNLQTNFVPAAIPQPVKIVVDGRMRIPLDAKLLRPGGKTLIVTANPADGEKVRKLLELGADVLEFPAKKGEIRLAEVMAELGARGIDSVLLEGGGGLNASALKEGIVDKLITFIAPKLIGGAGAPTFFGGAGIADMGSAIKLRHTKAGRCGEDVVVESEFIDKRSDALPQ